MTNSDSTAETRPAIEIMKERATESYALVMAAANGRELDVQGPHWKLGGEATSPLTLHDRGHVLRWQFLGSGVDSITRAQSDVHPAASEALARAYLRVDDEIGPVFVAITEGPINVVFRDGATRALLPPERESVDRFLTAVDAYHAHRREWEQMNKR
ncbi:MAG: hypothetical protein DCF16_14410 [Alphaproteobacteria bacterium]|nr:MAG: hypothetical protein DCF16_14410 [Alphaproteobacteria bacterium]